MRCLLLLILALATAPGCMDESCDDYVDYLCTCHEDDPEYDCEALRATYENADAATQEDCALALDEQQAQDAKDDLDCAW